MYNHLSAGKTIAFICLVLMVNISGAQVHSGRSFRELSGPEKRWVIIHPFVAKKAWKITQLARQETNKISEDPRLDHDGNGGQVDAFRHAYWMALLSQQICWKKARSLGKAHEKGNFLNFKKHRLEENSLPDSMASVMDMYNNNFGIELSRKNKYLVSDSLKELIIVEILSGNLRMLWKNENGKFLDCSGDEVPLEEKPIVWNRPRCLVPSNTGRK